MKNIIYSIVFICLPFFISAQTTPKLWEPLPLEFNYSPGNMYYDSIGEVSYIAGSFSKVNDTLTNFIKYDGQNFTLLPPAPVSNTGPIIRYRDKIYVGSHYGFISWNGSQWNLIDNVGVSSLNVYNDKLYVGGAFTEIAGHPIGKVAVWNDTTWTDLYKIDTVVESGFVNNIQFYKGNIYVGGNFNTADREIIDLAMFDGEKWISPGNFMTYGLGNVNDMLVWKDTLYIAGQFMESTGSPGNAIVKWDGKNWHRLNDGLLTRHPSITSLKVFNDELYVCGGFNIMDGINLGDHFRGFAKWNGSQWCSMNTHANNVIFKIGNWKNELFILGGFKVLNNDSIDRMAKWIGGDYTDTCSDPQTLAIDHLPDHQTELHIYPNPSTDVFNLSFVHTSNRENNAVLQIADLNGKVLRNTSVPLTQGVNQFKLDFTGFAAGTYFIQVKNESISGSAQVIKK